MLDRFVGDTGDFVTAGRLRAADPGVGLHEALYGGLAESGLRPIRCDGDG